MLRGRVTEFSQPHVLQSRLAEAGIGHGQSAVADIMFRVGDQYQHDPSRATVYFCDTPKIHPTVITGQPDGQPLPEHVTVEGLTVPKPGYWRGSFRINLNGSIHLEPAGEMTEAADPYAELRQPTNVVLT